MRKETVCNTICCTDCPVEQILPNEQSRMPRNLGSFHLPFHSFFSTGQNDLQI